MKNKETQNLLDALEQNIKEINQYELLIKQKKAGILNIIDNLKQALELKEPESDILDIIKKTENRFEPIEPKPDLIFGPNRPYQPKPWPKPRGSC